MFDSSRMFDQSERLIESSRQLASAAGMAPKAKKRAVESATQTANGASAEVVAAAAEGSTRALKPDDLVPLGTNYNQLFELFGESLFPFLTHRKDDYPSTLFV